MQLDILTPEANVFSGEVEYIRLPGVEGSFEVLDNHAPIISALKEGVVRIRTSGHKKEFSITSGIVEVINNKVSVLVESVVD